MYVAGQTPAALRQISTAAFTGVVPKNSAQVTFEPFPVSGGLVYTSPDDHSLVALSQGGLYDFGETVTRVLEMRALAAGGDISAIVADRVDMHTMALTVGGATPAVDLIVNGVEVGDIVTVVSTGPVTETYTVTAVNSASSLQVASMVHDRDLVALDVFTITNYDASVTRYTHTLAGSNTLDIDVATTHNTTVVTPATSRVIPAAPLIILPSQVLRVSTAAANALGWLDIYTVRGEFY